MTLEKEITLADIKNVAKVLKKLNNGWAKSVASIMFPGEDEATAGDKIYNLTSGRAHRDQQSYISFINAATEVKDKLEQEQKAAIAELDKIIN